MDAPRGELASRTRFMAAAAAGTALALLGVYAGLGVHDGFGDWDLHRVGRRFLRFLPWVLALSALGGALLRGFYARLLTGKPSGLGVLGTIVRAFAHFPLYGGVALFSIMFGFAVLGLRAAPHRLLGGEPPGTSDETLTRWLGTPIWFVIMPFNARFLADE